MISVVQGATRGIGLAVTELLLARGERVVATGRNPETSEGLTALRDAYPKALSLVPLDLAQEASIQKAVSRIKAIGEPLQLLFNISGVLHGPNMDPEKKLEEFRLSSFRTAMATHVEGPMLLIQQLLSCFPRNDRSVIANMSARVGSISDNRLGGWYSYRMSKAAQNMATKGLSLELGRRKPALACIALHPGTVDTNLSKPFQRSAKHIFDAREAATNLLRIIDSVTSEDTGKFFAWDGSQIPW